jgi:hypothetical protein
MANRARAPRRQGTWRWVAGALAAAALCPHRSTAAEGDERNVTVRLGERLTREDNLYRLPAVIDPQDLLGPAARREDVVNSTSAALAGHWAQGEQELALDTSVAANRFADNAHLDNTSGRGALDWNWRFGSRWSGQAGGRRERMLAGFANASSLERDLVDTTTYHLDTRFAAGARWRALASARESSASHDNAARVRDDVEIESRAVGLEYHTPREDGLGIEVRRARATFPAQPFLLGQGSASDYEERGASLNLYYVLTDKALFKASAGRVEREYALAPRGDFSGNVWSAELQWSPTESTQIAFKRWRELKAHLDAESDHFVSTGEGIVATWLPIDKIALSLQVARDEQRYIGADVDELVEPRHDTPTSGSFRFTYTPRERASFEVSYRQETRESNRFRFDYDAASVTLGGELRF